MFADEQASILFMWREALAILGRYPLATFLPAAVLGMLGGAPYYLIGGKINLPEEIVAMLEETATSKGKGYGPRKLC